MHSNSEGEGSCDSKSTPKLNRPMLIVESEDNASHSTCDTLKYADSFQDGDINSGRRDEAEEQANNSNSNIWTVGNYVQSSEISHMQGALTAMQIRERPLCEWECKSIRTWWKHHTEWVLSRAECFRTYWMLSLKGGEACNRHKQTQGENITNYLQKSLEEALDNYVRQVHNLSTIIEEQVVVGGDVDKLCDEWKEYQELSSVFRKFSDKMGFQLRRAFFSPKQRGVYKKKDTKTMYRVSTGQVSATMYYIGENIFRFQIMPREQFSDTMWDLFLSDWFRHYVKDIVVHLEALVRGDLSCICSNEKDGIKYKQPKSYLSPTAYYNPNPVDPEYQQDKRHPPDKLKTWGGENIRIQIANAPRTLIKQALVAGVVEMREALVCVQARGPLLDWELASLRTWFSDHYRYAHSMNNVLQKYHMPRLKKRIRVPDFFIMTNREIYSRLYRVTCAIDSLQVGDKIDQVLKLLVSYENRLIFSRELVDPMFTLLYHAYFSQEEHKNNSYRHIMAELFDDFAGPLVYLVGKEMFRRILMVRQELPDVDWHLKYGSKYIDFMENIVVHIQALQKGIPPEINRRSSSLLSLLETTTEEDFITDLSAAMEKISFGTKHKIKPRK